ncbi:DNA mismatch endonuclease Vsr [Stigmatella erecta]|uniref:DNA (cytosine-5-)-methyltransferase n=1 Tax=Stigmatella erecta TaxID=83460 RepID=A0A1I0AHU7_9BACT|nr:DNA mismatch endonuclease Vsr [Stigmatella erecta]SES93262.1 DNA mismatch endonuclease Vsr [Stigmatella erecta]
MESDRTVFQESGATPRRLNIIDLFAGVGGLTLGFLDRSLDPGCIFVPRLMVDIDPEAREVAIRNLPHIPYLTADVNKLTGAQARERAGLGPRDPVHVLVGGPPCQGFSWLGKRALEDERNLCVLDFLRMVKELRPMVAVMENVPLIVTSHDGIIIHEVCEGLANLGYASCADVLVASEFGVPQFRKRAFLIAYRSDLGIPPQLPKRTHERVSFASELQKDEGKPRFEQDKLPYVSVEEAIGDLPQLRAGEGDEVMFYGPSTISGYQKWARSGSVAIFNHRSRAHSSKYLEKISIIEEGGRNADLPKEQRYSDNYYSQAYARLHRNGLAQTITTSFSNPGSGRFMHYRDLRSITVREAARFQSFPDAFAFEGNNSTQMRHVGNAVPPLMARAVRNQVARDLIAAGVDAARAPGRPKKAPVKDLVQHSRIMRAVPSKNTTPEMVLRKALWSAGIRGYRLHTKVVPGNPDVLFPVERVAVFVDGCFWHGCLDCHHTPKSHTEYWTMKVQRNRERDAHINAECERKGWRVVRLWEHEVRESPKQAMAKICRKLGDRAL